MLQKKIEYNPKVIKFICDKIARARTMTEICDRYYNKSPLIPRMPKTVYRWINKYPDFKKAYEEAMKVKHLTIYDHILSLANEPPPDTGDFKRDQTVSRQKEFKVRTLLAVSGQIANKYVPELKDTSKDISLSAPVIKILNYYSQPAIDQKEPPQNSGGVVVEHKEDTDDQA